MTVWHIAAITHRGSVREVNEDAICVDRDVITEDRITPKIWTLSKDSQMIMIADGMGGHVHGALASRMVLEFLLTADADPAGEQDWIAAIQAANDRLYDLMEQRPHTIGMGSTLVGANLRDTSLFVFNVGDSRAYRHAPGNLIQLSYDDVPEPSVSAARHRWHAITQALGGAPFRTPVEPHIELLPPLLASEMLLLCSDGLTDMLTDASISDVLDANPDPERAVRTLFDRAMQAGGRDNISIIIVRSVN